jgi:hypothetical protein
MESTGNLDELRRKIAAGSYVVDTDLVAGTIVRKIVEATRLQRIVSEYRDARSREEGGHSRPWRAAQHRNRESPHR